MNCKLITLLSFIALVAPGCNDVYYRQPQPMGESSLEKIPDTYQGIYLLKGGELFSDEDQGESWMRLTDTMVYQYAWVDQEVPFIEGSDYDSNNPPETGDIVQGMIRGEMIDMTYIGDDWATYRSTKYQEIGLGDSMIIRQANNRIYLNLRENKQETEVWRLVLVERLRNGDLLFWAEDDYAEREAERFFEIEQIRKEGYGSYMPMADPTAEELDTYLTSGAYSGMLMWMSTEFDRYSVPEELLVK